MLVIAALPRADSPSAARYVREREGETAWTMHLSEEESISAQKPQLPSQLEAQISQREHVSAQVEAQEVAAQVVAGGGEEGVPIVKFDPSARRDDEDTLPSNYKEPSLDY